MLPQWEVGNFKRLAYNMKYIPEDHRAQSEEGNYSYKTQAVWSFNDPDQGKATCLAVIVW